MKKTARQFGNRSIFAPKAGGGRVQGELTERGFEKFQQAKRRLARIKKSETASDGDTVEALARGWEETIAYINVRRGQV